MQTLTMFYWLFSPQHIDLQVHIYLMYNVYAQFYIFIYPPVSTEGAVYVDSLEEALKLYSNCDLVLYGIFKIYITV
jgi:hypothetical protein